MHRQRGSVSVASISLHRNRTGSIITIPRARSDSNRLFDGVDNDQVVYHPVEPRARVAQLPPVMVSLIPAAAPVPESCILIRHVPQSKTIDDHPLCWLGFEEDCIMTSCQDGEFISQGKSLNGYI